MHCYLGYEFLLLHFTNFALFLNFAPFFWFHVLFFRNPCWLRPKLQTSAPDGLNVLYAPCWSGISRETWSCCLKMSLDDRRDTKAGNIRRADPAHITFSRSVSGGVTSSRRPPSSSMRHEPRPPHTTPAPGCPPSSPILPKRHSPFRRSSKSPPLTWSWVLSNHPKLDRISQSTPGNPP